MWSVMPTYEYRCAKCGEHLEVFQSFSETPLTKHAGCGGKLAKVLSAAGIVLKGSGFVERQLIVRRLFVERRRSQVRIGLRKTWPTKKCPDPSVWAGMTDEPGTHTGVWDTGGGSRSTGRVQQPFPPLPSPKPHR